MSTIASKIHMVDVAGQYQRLKGDIDRAVAEVIDSTAFINGPKVKDFTANLSSYLDARVIPCANGTDALQIALMSLDLSQGDKVMLPAFTYVATAEVIALLGLEPVLVDVDEDSFNLTSDIVERHMTDDIKAIVPVHLYGQCAEMEGINYLAEMHGIKVIEDNAQSIGADYLFEDGRKQKSGTIGDIGCTSFYPSKNLGAYGDGGAISTKNKVLGDLIHMIANHGQSKKYIHDLVGCNSRLDSIQAAILDVKLKHLDDFNSRRQKVADLYDLGFFEVDEVRTPYRCNYSTHVFHQYTIKVEGTQRDELKSFLKEKGIPSMIYYPLPLYNQKAYTAFKRESFDYSATETLCKEVLSLPIHTEMHQETVMHIVDTVKSFFAHGK